MNMTREQAAQKYGDNKIMTVPKSLITTLISQQIGATESLILINRKLTSAYRRDAEFDTENLQVIPYILILGADVESDSGDLYVFTTHRIDGDNRLVGKYSIGTGGHIEDGECLGEAIIRELEEEVGLDQDHWFDLDGNSAAFSHAGAADQVIIYDDTSEVNSVHAGLILACMVEDMNHVAVAEPDKLEGEWVKVEDLFSCHDSQGLLEDWSHIALHRVFGEYLAKELNV